MSKRSKRILGLLDRLHIMRGAADVEALVARLNRRQHPTILAFINANAINLAWSSLGALAAFRKADIVLRDGVGLGIGLGLLGRRPGGNMNGTDFVPQLLRRLRYSRVAVFGTAHPWLEPGAAAIGKLGHQIIAQAHGFHPPGDYLGLALQSRPDIILLAMGMPHQELVAAALKDAADWPVLIIPVGGLIDFLGGKVARAPAAWRRWHLEWAWRLLQEPGRLAGRYLVGNALFLARVAVLRWHQAKLQAQPDAQM